MCCYSMCGCDEVFLFKLCDFGIQCSSHETGEGKYIIDLIGEVASACCEDKNACLEGEMWFDFGVGIGESEYDGMMIHLLDHYPIDIVSH